MEGKAHEASLDQAEKKTYGAERLGARVTRVIGPRRGAALESEKRRLPDLDCGPFRSEMNSAAERAIIAPRKHLNY